MERILLIRKGLKLGLCALFLLLMQAKPIGLYALETPADDKKNGPASSSEEAEYDADENEDMAGLLEEAATLRTGPTASPETGPPLPVRIEGELLTSLWMTQSHRMFTDNRLDLNGWGNVSDIRVKGRLRVGYQDLEGKDQANADIRELYAEYKTGLQKGRYAEIALGKKIIYWGKADEIRPMDRVSPQDLTSFLFHDMNERKTGRIGVFLNLSPARDVRFEGFWSPYFEAGKTPGVGDFFEPVSLRKLLNNGIEVREADSPDQWSADAGLGGRVLFSVNKADIGLYAFSGQDPNPTYRIDRVGTHPIFGFPVPQSVSPFYPDITLYGADIERSTGPFVLRAEAAFQPEGAYFPVDWQHRPLLLQTHPKGVVEKEQLQYVLGLDRNDLLVRNLFFNFQYFGEYIPDHENWMTSPESRTGVTGLLRYSFLDSRATISYRLTTIFKNKDQRHRLEVSYKPISWAQVSLGGIWYGGDCDTGYFGQYDNKDFIYGKIKLVF